MTAEAARRGAAARPKRSFRITYVEVILWSLRILILVIVVGGTIGTLIKGRYTIEQWFDFVMFGLTIGGIYALIALGYTMVYGILRLINFAHGDITMTGAFSAFFLARHLDRTGFLDAYPLLSMLAITALAMVVCSVIALAVERICYRPFRHVATLAPLICAIGASFFLQHSFRGLYGSTIRSYPDPEWLKARAETEKDGPLITSLTNYILSPTAYSKMQ